MKRCVGLLLVAIMASIASCTSITSAPNSVPPKKTSDDCLVLIRTTVINKANVPTAREYRLQLSSGYATLTVPNDSEGFLVVKIREPGVKIVGLTSELNKYQFTGNNLDEPLDINLPYVHGGVVVADFTFIQTLEKADERHFLSTFDFQKTSEESKTAVLEQFRKRRGAQSWL